MKTFKDLFIHLGDIDKDEFSKQFKIENNDLWERKYDKDDDEYIWSISFLYKGAPQAGLWIMEKSKDTLYVSNVVPNKKSELTLDEYNSIIDKFYKEVLEPFELKLGLKISVTKGYYQLEDYLNDENQKLFLAFSNLANKSTKSSHPLDRKRWYKFIISSFNSNQILPTNILQGFLIENGWTKDNAVDLLIEYEFAIGLLTSYENMR